MTNFSIRLLAALVAVQGLSGCGFITISGDWDFFKKKPADAPSNAAAVRAGPIAPGASPLVLAQPTAPGPSLRDRWIVTKLPRSSAYLRVQMVTDQVAFVLGSQNVLKSEDGGKTWFDLDVGPAANDELTGICFVDASAGWLLGKKAAYVTKDGGNTWVANGVFTGLKQDVRDRKSDRPKAIAFKNVQEGVILGFDTSFATTDGGLTWTERPFDPEASGYGIGAGRVFAVDGGYVIPGPRGLLRSEGAGWKIQPDTMVGVRTGGDYSGVTFGDATHGWAEIYKSVRRTSDGGRTWQEVACPKDKKANGIYLAGVGLPGHVVLRYDDRVLESLDDGTTWNEWGGGLAGAQNTDRAGVIDLSMLDGNHGLMLTPFEVARYVAP